MITTSPSHLNSEAGSPDQTTFSPTNRQNCGILKAPVVADLHTEISSLKSARQTDAFILSLREREIEELKNLLHAKVVNASTEVSGAPYQLLNGKHGLLSSNNDSNDTLVFPESRECRDLEPLLHNVTKLCDSPQLPTQPSKASGTTDGRLLSSLPFQLSESSELVGPGGVEMKRSGGLRLTADSTYDDQYHGSAVDGPAFVSTTEPTFTDNDLQSFRSLSIHTRGFGAAQTDLLGPDPASRSNDNLHRSLETSSIQGFRGDDSPLFHASNLVLRDPSPLGRIGSTTRCSSTSELPSTANASNIWSQYPSSYTLSSSLKNSGSMKDFGQAEMYRQASLNQRGSRGDYPQEDPRSMNRAFADQDPNSRFKGSKFHLDPTSPAYVPSQFRSQNRGNSVTRNNGRETEKGVWDSYPTSRQLSQNAYPEFDEAVGESNFYQISDSDVSPPLTRPYSAHDSGFNQSQMLQNSYIPGGMLIGDTQDYEDFGAYNQDFNEFGDSVHYQVLVEKIIQTNDQPASLHLQQNIKHLSGLIQNPLSDAAVVATAIRSRNLLMDAVRPQALSLMRNRFGNFLMQRCLEFGTREQVKGLVLLMGGHMYPLSCDRFGCHVVQKALDVCEDDVKLSIVTELFRAIPETITHRFACHVWQRVFETKWGTTLSPPTPIALEQFPLTANMVDSTSPAQVQITFSNRSKIVQRVDAALKGQWHLVANDENGSLVVQEIVKEVLVYAADIAKGQWGNWVIQHLLDHGTPADKSHIFKVVARNVTAFVEKVLKSCQRRELFDIVDVVISPVMRETGCPGILEMMNNQYANYVVQHILTLSDPAQRDTCVRLIAPHLPVLRGSKYGQRVAAIVEKHIRTCQQRFGTIINVPNNNIINNLNHFSRSGSNSSTFNSRFSATPSNPLFNNAYNPFEGAPLNNQSMYLQNAQINHTSQHMYGTSPTFRESSLLNQMMPPQPGTANTNEGSNFYAQLHQQHQNSMSDSQFGGW
ncbi:ARM repeat-containing protein [Rhizoclosmatium globosum]|uniref:ARM repeat-containing protein n=1 Tax=Rhizoclosmatium globosum TaxID=329046 RepID=A0A1Y2CBD8_9FUNG|nr:ARM repeat-containing protein [Rhizoclosmatium globosum]|eukprot:ORY44361.1 ARM repeat-containing protein [Rhizoclosmatium globosum]